MEVRNAFRQTTIALSLFGLATLGSACFGHSSSKVKDDQLGRLSAADREQLIERERDVNVAKSNIDASKVALEEAKGFQDSAHAEAKAAKEQQKQLRDDLKRAEKQGTGDTQTIAQRAQLRAQQANAIEAKSTYSDKLVDLREAQVANSEAEHDLMEARLSRAQYDLLRENDLAGDLDGNKFAEREGKAAQEFQKSDQQVQEQLASARASKQAWSGLQQSARAGVAEPREPGAGVQSPELIEAPRPPDSLNMKSSGGSAQAKSAGAKGQQPAQGEAQPRSQAQKQRQRAAQPAAPQQQPAAPQTATPPAAPTPRPAPTTPQSTTGTGPVQPSPSTAQP